VSFGREGRWEEAAAAFARADETMAKFAWMRQHARRLVAEVALAEGWGEPARWLREALAFFEGCGNERIASACRSLLARSGTAVPRRRGGASVPLDLRALNLVHERSEKMSNARLEAIFTDVVTSLQRIIAEHQVTSDEYRVATEWLTEAGNQGYEIPLLLDVFLSPTVDDINFAENGGTESNVEGPFYVAEAPLLSRPYVLPQRDDEPGDILVFSGRVLAGDGTPLPGAMLDIWHATSNGEYSRFQPGLPDYNLRGRLSTDEDGSYEFRTVVPSPYEIPKTGATGKLLAGLGRHAFRPGHIHFKVSCQGFRLLTTQIYFEGDPWLGSDVAGAVKPSLVISLEKRESASTQLPYLAGSYDFVLTPA